MSDEVKKQSFFPIVRNFYFLSYIVLSLTCFVLFPQALSEMSFELIVFTGVVALSYTLLYMIPSFISVALINALCKICKTSEKITKRLVYTTMVLTANGVSLFFLFDAEIFKGFGFHINSFILNIITTPGGLDSMGGGYGMPMVATIWSVCFIALFSGLLYAAHHLEKKQLIPTKLSRKAVVLIVVAYLGLQAYDRLTFGISHFYARSHIVSAAQRYPAYIPTTFRSFLKKRLGLAEVRKTSVSVKQGDSALQYPLNEIKLAEPQKKFNIVWLVAESWRYGTLTKEIMPSTYEFQKKTVSFEQHYSGGNGTRMGMFSMFYGLYGPYWFKVLNERKSPVIMDALQEQDYQIELFTSAKFSYPEFDKTLFSKIPLESMHASAGNGGFKNDRENTSDLLKFIKNRDESKPFMTFMFFESPHAPYTFPEDLVVRKDYLPHTNYATIDVKENIELIYNRYLNSVHHLDTQHKRIFDFLENEKLMDDTIVIITGDHGEEFMEAGRWGHNSEFHQDQIRVPMLVYVPGQKPMMYNDMSSHLDMPATIGPYIGIQNPSSDYSLGHNLLAGEKRDFTVTSSWNNICFIGDKGKVDISLSNALSLGNRVTSVDDKAVSESEKEAIEKDPKIFEMIKGLGTYLKGAKR